MKPLLLEREEFVLLVEFAVVGILAVARERCSTFGSSSVSGNEPGSLSEEELVVGFICSDGKGLVVDIISLEDDRSLEDRRMRGDDGTPL